MSPDCCGPDGTSENDFSADRIARSFDREVADLALDDKALPEPSPISLHLQRMLEDVAEVRPTVLDLGS